MFLEKYKEKFKFVWKEKKSSFQIRFVEVKDQYRSFFKAKSLTFNKSFFFYFNIRRKTLERKLVK